MLLVRRNERPLEGRIGREETAHADLLPLHLPERPPEAFTG